MKFIKSHLLVDSLLIIVLFSCHSGISETKSVKQKISSLTVDAIIVHPSVLDQSISVSGTLRPFEETVLMPEVSGRVVTINLPEGKTVKKGMLLIELFNDDLQAQLQKSQAQLQIAEDNLKRQSELKKVDGISQSEYDQAQLQVNSIKADIEVLNVQIGRTKIRAPFDGTVGLRNISPGAQVTQSTALVTIREVDQLKLDFSVPEKYSSAIIPGTTVKFMVQGDDKKYEATVMATEQGIEPSTRNLKARAVVKSQSSSLIPGAFANVELRLGENRQALLVPTQAIIPQEKNKKLIVAKQGKANFVIVKTGTRTSSRVEILSGINAGDTIVVNGILFLKQDADLKFSKVTRDSI
jgi:membrane fusion protein (multidrug efflux system)